MRISWGLGWWISDKGKSHLASIKLQRSEPVLKKKQYCRPHGSSAQEFVAAILLIYWTFPLEEAGPVGTD